MTSDRTNRKRLGVALALAGGLAGAAAILAMEPEWGADVLKALFGLSGGTTAGGV